MQALAGTSFVVNGVAEAHDLALTTASAEVKLLDGFPLAATFEGEHSVGARHVEGCRQSPAAAVVNERKARLSEMVDRAQAAPQTITRAQDLCKGALPNSCSHAAARRRSRSGAPARPLRDVTR
jgi:hypothetical protein